MKKVVYLFSIIVLLSSCGNQNQSSENATSNSTNGADSNTVKDFKDVYSEFFSSILDDNSTIFNSFIHPQHGLYIVESSGAMLKFEKVTDISTFRSSMEKKSIFDINKTKIGLQMIEEELPTAHCDSAGFYTKRGCYTEEVNTFKDEKIWTATNLSQEEKDQISKLAQTIVKTVINTANYRYYFSKIEDKWYITFIDMRKPCTA